MHEGESVRSPGGCVHICGSRTRAYFRYCWTRCGVLCTTPGGNAASGWEFVTVAPTCERCKPVPLHERTATVFEMAAKACGTRGAPR